MLVGGGDVWPPPWKRLTDAVSGVKGLHLGPGLYPSAATAREGLWRESFVCVFAVKFVSFIILVKLVI